MKGGGVKGLAFVGALLELEKSFSFDAFSGTSAGAVTAILLGAGYKPSELLNILKEKSFRDFKDASFLGSIRNLKNYKGLYPGTAIENWINQLLKKKINQLSEIKMSNLATQTILYASRIHDGTLTFDSCGERKETYAAFATRCSMSIPYYFFPKEIDGVRVFDGGLRNNFPLKKFIEGNKQKPFVGIYLRESKADNTKSIFKRLLSRSIVKNVVWAGIKAFVDWSMVGELTNLTIEGEERALVDENINKIIIIDTYIIDTTDFDLSDLKKRFLVLSGRVAALSFIKKNYLDIPVNQDYFKRISAELETLRTQIDE